MPWAIRKFKGDEVWARVDEDGDLVVEDGRVPIRYSDDDSAKVYRASPTNVADDNLAFQQAPFADTREESTTVPPEVDRLPPPEDDVMEVHVDGASIKEAAAPTGPSGIGVLTRTRDDYRELHQYIGETDNAVAELAAALVGLDLAKEHGGPVRLFTDSQYVKNMIVKRSWNASSNKRLVSMLRNRADEFDDLEVNWVRGHSGDPQNERVDDLANRAVARHGS